MPHIHLGLVPSLVIYLSWFVWHVVVQVIAIQFHETRIGQALATFG